MTGSEDLSTVSQCCRSCGTEFHEIDGDWGVEVRVRSLGDIDLDSPYKMQFCTLDCYNDAIKGEIVLGDDA